MTDQHECGDRGQSEYGIARAGEIVLTGGHYMLIRDALVQVMEDALGEMR